MQYSIDQYIIGDEDIVQVYIDTTQEGYIMWSKGKGMQ